MGKGLVRLDLFCIVLAAVIRVVVVSVVRNGWMMARSIAGRGAFRLGRCSAYGGGIVFIHTNEDYP